MGSSVQEAPVAVEHVAVDLFDTAGHGDSSMVLKAAAMNAMVHPWPHCSLL